MCRAICAGLTSGGKRWLRSLMGWRWSWWSACRHPALQCQCLVSRSSASFMLSSARHDNRCASCLDLHREDSADATLKHGLPFVLQSVATAQQQRWNGLPDERRTA